MSVYNIVVSGPKFTESFPSNVEDNVVDNTVFARRLLDPFQRYSRLKSRVVRNLAHC